MTAELGVGPWERHSDWWANAFTGGADLEYERQLLPLVREHVGGARRILDVGSGEGQVARHVSEDPAAPAGRLVYGIDPSPAQLEKAERHGGLPRYLRGTGERLPFRDGCFDAAYCCLVIEHVVDPESLFSEVARVLEPGGRFVLLVNHPIFQGPESGMIDDRILGEQYWRVGSYLREEVVIEEVDPGIDIPFAHRPISRYLNPLAERGLYLTRMEEPPPLADMLARSVAPELEKEIPRLLLMRLERL